MENHKEQEIRKVYRDFLRRELQRPEMRRDKRAFLAAHFKGEGPFFVRPAFYIPALSLTGIILILFLLPQMVSKVRFAREIEGPESPTFRTPGLELETYPTAYLSSVEVRRVTSRMGSTMVYQKLYRDVPITIIWVFSGGSST
jgi:hypothetical protein